ncbi:hypothetical protein GWI33_005193 [Rhynchophorus ferrugineus]|uniref:Uncharacterized protein n=1 Tax=Rhynchophorus ferrugineus TaxID=354439 RepID=A0A834IWC3_RHYFE|nr:hypothetical protein GWI33_005193 [Rhynchophorus ferrugineus]
MNPRVSTSCKDQKYAVHSVTPSKPEPTRYIMMYRKIFKEPPPPSAVPMPPSHWLKSRDMAKKSTGTPDARKLSCVIM